MRPRRGPMRPSLCSGLDAFPALVSEEELDRFEDQFWEWYDKRNAVPEIDSLVKMNMPDYKGEELPSELIENMRRHIEAERDIDRRTIVRIHYFTEIA